MTLLVDHSIRSTVWPFLSQINNGGQHSVRYLHIALSSSVLGMLGACSTAQSGTPPPVAQAPLVTRVSGQLAYRERIALPPTSRVEVVISNITEGAGQEQVVARSVRSLNQAGPPIPFTLDVSRDRLPAGPLFGLRAFIYGDDGRQMFRTGTPVLVDLGKPVFDTGTVMLRMTPSGGDGAAGVPGIHGTRWVVGQLGAVRTTGPRPSFTFALDKTLNGSGGCNQFSGTYTLNGDRLAIDTGAGTLRACEPRLMKQEASFLKMLGEVASAAVDENGRLTLRTRSGEAIVARRDRMPE